MAYCTRPDQTIKILDGQFSGMTGTVISCEPSTGAARVFLDNRTILVLVPPTAYDYEVVGEPKEKVQIPGIEHT